MKGNPEIIAVLNSLLASEHAAMQQYRTHAAMCENWGYDKLAAYLYKRAEEEQGHAKELMDRILLLEGVPDFVAITAVEIGENVIDMFSFDQAAEMIAITGYTEGIEKAVELKDFATRALMEHILVEEESHLNVIEENLTQITNSGIENYLIVQI